MTGRIPTRWRFREAPRQQEWFVSRVGDRERSAAIVQQAQQWYRRGSEAS